jgi:Excalibur calcium-binding domain
LIVAVLLAMFAATYIVSSPIGPASAVAADRDCSDFRTQKRAQRFFNRHNPRRDPHGLDADNDRIACEDNRCLCTRRWHEQHGKVAARRE